VIKRETGLASGGIGKGIPVNKEIRMKKKGAFLALFLFIQSLIAFSSPGEVVTGNVPTGKTPPKPVMIASVDLPPGVLITPKLVGRTLEPPSLERINPYPLDQKMNTELPWNGDVRNLMPRLKQSMMIFLEFYDAEKPNKKLRIGEVGLKCVQLEESNSAHHECAPIQPVDSEVTQYVISLDYSNTKAFTPQAVVKLIATFTDDTKEERYFILDRFGKPYGLALFPFVGLWVPVTLFGTDLNLSGGGLPFATLPLTAALGYKFYFSGAASSQYIGLSLAGGAAFGGPSPATSSAAAQDFFFRNFDLLLLADFAEYLYLGFGAKIDLAREPAKWSPLLAFGVGPQIVTFLK
jgi:hypothetical protein